MPGVLISYRREDTGFLAAELADRLRTAGLVVKIDIGSLEPGTDFDSEVGRWIDEADVVVVLVGPRWAGEFLDSPERRIDDPTDFFRSEILRALNSYAAIVPVGVGDLQQREIVPDQWPKPLRRICDLQWHDLTLVNRGQAIPELVDLVRERSEESRTRRLRSSLPDTTESAPPSLRRFSPSGRVKHRAGGEYDAPSELVIGVNTALEIGRPLLLEGPAGSGKTSSVDFIAQELGWARYEYVLRGESTMQDLLYSIDSERRLHDAQTSVASGHPLPMNDYVEPGVIWWTFDSASAATRGGASGSPVVDPAIPPENRDRDGALLLLDDVDIGDEGLVAAVVNVFGARSFVVREIAEKVVSQENVLLVLVSESRRPLSPELRRRVVRVFLPGQSAASMLEMASLACPDVDVRMIQDVLKVLDNLEKESGSVFYDAATFVDLIRAMASMGVEPSHATFPDLLASLGFVA